MAINNAIGDNAHKGAVRKRTQLKTKAAEKFKGVRRERQWPSFLSSVSQSQLPCSLDFLCGGLLYDVECVRLFHAVTGP